MSMDPVRRTSPDLTVEHVRRLAELFPSVVTETRDAEGGVRQAVDFDLLRQELSDHVVEGPQERYQLDWPGKRAAAFAANAPTTATLRPDRAESVDFDTTKNVFIEGDNLEVLKVLQESYLGRVKAIFIDPPYNTQSDLIYRDDFATSRAEYLRRSGQASSDGVPLRSNKVYNGRLHSDWLSMIFPRIKLARNLLTLDGVIFVTIDDTEVSNLRSIMDEVFGSENLISCLIWQSRTSISDDQEISQNHTYVLTYARDRQNLKFWGEPLRQEEYENPDNDPRGPWKLVPLDANKPGGDTYYEVTNPVTGQRFLPPEGRSWAVNRATMSSLMEDGRIVFGKLGNSAPKRKLFYQERVVKGDTRTPSSLLLDAGTTKSGSAELSENLGVKKVFDYPKPSTLVQRLISYATLGAPDAIVMDFFAGSGTTAEATLRLNSTDDGRRSFIVVQIPEPISSGRAHTPPDLKTISQIARKRIKNAGDRLTREFGDRYLHLDTGFRAYRLDASPFMERSFTPENTTPDLLAKLEDPILPDRTPEDLLTHVLLAWGLDLAVDIQTLELAGQQVFDVEDGALLAAFGAQVTDDLAHAMARREPARAVFLDSGFASDAARINVEQIFREVSPDTEIKVL